MYVVIVMWYLKTNQKISQLVNEKEQKTYTQGPNNGIIYHHLGQFPFVHCAVGRIVGAEMVVLWLSSKSLVITYLLF